MAELNLQQIVDKLNAEFAGAGRRLVFWYDEAGEFADDIDNFALVNATVYKLEPHAQFKAKVFFERQDRENNYLIYAPFAKPELKDNHLADTLRYSSEFAATRAALICRDLHIDDKFRSVIQHFIDVRLLNKENTARLYDLEINLNSKSIIYTAMMCVLCRTRTVSLEAILVALIASGKADDKLEEFEKYELLQAFWFLCQDHFGYNDGNPTFDKFIISLFITEAHHALRNALPQPWQALQSTRSGNVIAFLDSLKNNFLYAPKYDELSAYVAHAICATELLKGISAESLMGCDSFQIIDSILIKWIVERLLAEDTSSVLNTLTIPQVCQARQKMHFSKHFISNYEMLSNACELILLTSKNLPFDFNALLKDYQANGWLVDFHYRKFYQAYESISDCTPFEKLRELIENIYTEWLGKLLPVWNKFFSENDHNSLPSQRSFYTSNVAPCRERVLVIISDAMRYEVVCELSNMLKDHEKCTVNLSSMIGVLPSFTPLGMAALLPHKELTLNTDGKALCDGKSTIDLAHRQTILQDRNPKSICVKFDDINRMKRQELRQLLAGKEVIYIYHNQIDARGEAAATENELFTACQEAVQEIHDMVIRLTEDVSTTHYVVTADHGFLYRHGKLHEYDKLASQSQVLLLERRFMLTSQPIRVDGIESVPMSRFTNPADNNMVAFPIGADVFKCSGGMNYVHGGSSPQELLIPVLDVRTARGHQETKSVSINIVSMIPKVTNLITTLEFLQSEAVSDTMKSAMYRIRFEDASGNIVSNEFSYQASSREKEPQQRLFSLRFTLKNQKYERSKPYYVVAYDEHDIQTIRHEVIIDIAFADDFGFNF